jgi:predicted LPLAT superfamily acyltransferase
MGAHLGSFEVTRALGRRQPGLRVAMAMYEDNARKINAMLAAVDPALALDIIPLGTMDSMLRIRARLDAGAFVGVLGDRSFGAERFERVPFLGAPAALPTSAMRAAAMLRRPVIFMAGLYRGGNRYHIVFEELADFSATSAADRDEAVRAALARYAAALERHCRSDPYNWFNFYDFWREPAAAEGGG